MKGLTVDGLCSVCPGIDEIDDHIFRSFQKAREPSCSLADPVSLRTSSRRLCLPSAVAHPPESSLSLYATVETWHTLPLVVALFPSLSPLPPSSQHDRAGVDGGEVLTNGIEVKFQRNALSVIDAPTGNEEDDDFEFKNFQWNGSDMGE
nr:uncharacterized protein LOC109170301 [Ipomoea trifida]